MNFVSNLAIMVVPRWVRIAVLVILALLGSIYLATAAIGIIDSDRPGWIEAGTYILGILLPFLIGGLLLSYSHSGVDALVSRSALFLTETVPAMTVLFEEPGQDFEASKTSGRFPKIAAPEIQIQAAANSSIANYVVLVRPSRGLPNELNQCLRRLPFRVELNATKANVNILILRSLVKDLSKAADVTELFGHSIAGARHEGYWIADSMTDCLLDGKPYLAIVAVKRLAPEFLTNPVHQLDFAQDLMLMLRAMLHERPELFEPATGASV